MTDTDVLITGGGDTGKKNSSCKFQI